VAAMLAGHEQPSDAVPAHAAERHRTDWFVTPGHAGGEWNQVTVIGFLEGTFVAPSDYSTQGSGNGALYHDANGRYWMVSMSARHVLDACNFCQLGNSLFLI
jgi:hypothetical protein